MFDKLIGKRYFWATHSSINPIKEAAYTIQRHWMVLSIGLITKSITAYWKGSTPFSRLLKQKSVVIEDQIPLMQSSICSPVNPISLNSILTMLPTQSDKEPNNSNSNVDNLHLSI